MSTARYREWFDAIRNKQRVSYRYKKERREGCPHVLGLDKTGQEKVLILRIVPGGPVPPQWRCLFVDKTDAITQIEGRWLEGESHKTRHSCVVDVDIDVNRAAKQRFLWPR
jgi:hypothetical protein